ncbi:protein KRI1 homolog [Lycorma delicatula]|uniref:protein KRI1 homolog n=1 Tax=Lycorma delicatula TaxID=130591 RepID=UPI003F51537A
MHSLVGFSAGEGDLKSEEESSSTSSEEDEDACELTENFEKKFFRTLSCLKKKDPQIYDKDARFFEKIPEIDDNAVKEKRKKKTETPFTLREYEKNLLENGGLISDEDESSRFPDKRLKKKTYVEEEKELKESFKNIVNNDSDESDAEIGGLFREHSKTKSEKRKEDEDYREWLKGQRNELDDKTAEGDMKYLHDFWNDPTLDEGEKFLRDYILNKRFLEKDDNEDPSDKFVTLEEDERILNTQIQFEHKYNFRFEEPDQEFIKRYPRIMENSMRKRDDRRKLKREAIKKRKLEEKKQKLKDLKKLQALKYKEIEEKIKQIKEVTGNEELGFKDEDIEKDFDPNEHDLQMQKLFSEEFYNQEENEKPLFTDDLNLDQYKDNNDDEYYCNGTGESNYPAEPYCEDEDFNMDCDFTPEKAALAKQKKLELRQKKKQKKKLCSARESIMLNQNIKKPVFDEKLHKTFQNYLDEYYSLDCEDFIGDMPCRFKYRQVVPNNYGLTIDEILAADDKELNKWCSVNKMYQIKPQKVEYYEVKAYEKKSKNEELKRKVLPSLYKSDQIDINEDGDKASPKKKKKKNKNKKVDNEDKLNGNSSKNDRNLDEIVNGRIKKQNKREHENEEDNLNEDETGVNVTKHEHKKKKFKYSKENEEVGKSNSSSFNYVEGGNNSEKFNTKESNSGNKEISVSKKKKQKKTILKENITKKNYSNENRRIIDNANKSGQSKFKGNQLNKNSNKRKSNLETFYNDISNTRLKAYGIKPKKFKNKIKYGGINQM